MKSIVFCFCILAALKLSAQQADTLAPAQPLFYSTNQAGLLEGSSGSSFLLQSVNGVQYGNWSLGLGAGIDKYGDRSIPVFLQVMRQLQAKRLPLYLYADAGLNIPWLYSNQNAWTNNNIRNGLYFDAGLQYKWLIHKRQGFVFSLGYTEKRYANDRSEQLVCITTPCPVQKNTLWYTYRRIAVKAGWRF